MSNIMNDNKITMPNALAQMYVQSVSPFCKIDPLIVNANISLVRSDAQFEREVSLESALFISDNFGLLLAALVMNTQNCRELFANAIDVECSIDEMPAMKRSMTRARLNQMTAITKTHCMELGLTVFDDATLAVFVDHIAKGYSDYENTNFIKHLDDVAFTDDDREILGLILSNWVYLLRAFNNNAAFFNDAIVLTRYIKDHIND